jgi:hypothetical protein
MNTVIVVSSLVAILPALMICRFLWSARRAGKPMPGSEIVTGIWIVYTIVRVADVFTGPVLSPRSWAIVATVMALVTIALGFAQMRRLRRRYPRGR